MTLFDEIKNCCTNNEVCVFASPVAEKFCFDQLFCVGKGKIVLILVHDGSRPLQVNWIDELSKMGLTADRQGRADDKLRQLWLAAMIAGASPSTSDFIIPSFENNSTKDISVGKSDVAIDVVFYVECAREKFAELEKDFNSKLTFDKNHKFRNSFKVNQVVLASFESLLFPASTILLPTAMVEEATFALNNNNHNNHNNIFRNSKNDDDDDDDVSNKAVRTSGVYNNNKSNKDSKVGVVIKNVDKNPTLGQRGGFLETTHQRKNIASHSSNSSTRISGFSNSKNTANNDSSRRNNRESRPVQPRFVGNKFVTTTTTTMQPNLHNDNNKQVMTKNIKTNLDK